MNTREKIIVSARNLFETYGYKKVSMEEIAIKTGITKKTLYSYFSSKDELFGYFITEEVANMKMIVTKIESLNLSPTKKLHEMIYELIKYKKNSKFINTITREIQDIKSSNVKKFDNKINENIRGFIEERLTLSIKNKEIKKVNVKIVGFIIYNLYMTTLFSKQNIELDEKEISDTLTLILKEGLLNEGE